MKKLHSLDLLTLIIALTITSIGLIFVLSSSYIWAEYKFDDALYFFKRQALFAALGVVGMLFVSRIDYNIYKKHATLLFLGSVFLLTLVLVPGIGMVRGGARSWIGIGAFSLQPSEFVKLGLIIFLAKYMSNYAEEAKSFKKGVIPLMFFICLVFGIIMLQPDFGSGMVIVCTGIVMLFVCGVPIRYFVYFMLTGLGGIVVLILSAPYRLARITSYLDPWSDQLGSGFQIIQSLFAIAPGGLFGVGLGNSVQKYYYLPEPQTDFIFAIVSEELGFIGAIGVLSLFAFFFVRCTYIIFRTEDLFAKYFVVGIMSMLMIQVMINIGVVIGLLPVTGITLPLMSYGGSSLTITLLSIGIILNISRHTQ
ncbi:MAG TPA: stage V sporulation protein E [Firmicutes bacterium]|nr:stage V sporulation protein E [Bacillota bacterium]